MIDIDKFSKRLKKVLDYYQLSAAAFAEKINVQRSSISHLLSGRNKPSLDFVLKVLNEFKEIEIYWFINGKGSFPKTEIPSDIENTTTPTLFAEIDNQTKSIQKETVKSLMNSNKTDIERIVIFFKNGKFKEYLSE
jgi:transcriptional regulator with XRE-family HTH domain